MTRWTPISSSTLQAGAPGCRSGWRSGDLSDRARTSIDVGIGYATHQLRIPDGLIAEKVIVAGASCEQPLGLGMLYYEDGTWGLTTFGVAKVEPPHDFAAMCALADEIVPAHVAAAIRHGEPIGDVAFHKYPTSRWRRYDKLDRFPAGIIPFGDAVVSFNPTFGQGMTMTSLQAGHLRGRSKRRVPMSPANSTERPPRPPTRCGR